LNEQRYSVTLCLAAVANQGELTMMYGAKSLKCLILPIETRYKPAAKVHAQRTIAANWQALSPVNPAPSLPVHVPASLQASQPAAPMPTSGELMAMEWLARETVKASLRTRRYGRAKLANKEAGHGHKVPAGNYKPSQLWPAEIRAAKGFGVIDTNKRGGQSPNYATMSLAQLMATSD
jgi:hypothetical protein